VATNIDMMEFIAEQTGDVFVRAGVDGVIRYVSGSLRQLGHEPAAVIGTTGIELVHPGDRERFLRNGQATLLGERQSPYGREHRFLRGDGSWVWMEGNPRVVSDAQGRIVEVVNVFRDITERKAAEAHAEAQGNLFRTAFEHAGVGKALVGPDGAFIQVNPAFCDLVGYSASAMLDLDFQAITHPDDLNADLDLLGQLTRGEISTYRLEKRYLRADGYTVWVDLTVSAIRDVDGEAALYVAEVQDLTPYREAEAALRESEARYRFLADNATDILASFSADARFTYLSPAIETVLGYAPEELIGQRTRAIMHPDDYVASLKTYGEHLAGPNRAEPFHFEYRALHKDGRTVWLAAHPRAVFDAAGELVGFHDVVRDVTDRRATEAALAESEARFRLLAENASDLVMDTRPDGVLTYISPSSLALTGYASEEVVGKTARRWVHPEDWGTVVAAFTEQVASRGKAPRRTIEYRLIAKDGRELWFESSPSANVDPSTGEVVSITDAGRDVTARRALEARLSEARVAAENAAQVKADFMANMSHEIRTPLTAILGFTSLLGARAELPDDVRHKVNRISTAGQTLLAIVNDVLDFSKLEAGQMPIKRRPVPIGETLSECMTLFEPQAEAKGIGLRLEGDKDLPVAEIDPDRLRQVLLNLVGNAVKFTDAGSVTLKAAYDPRAERLRIEVIDTGRGMDEEARDRLFQRFSQIDASSTRVHGGTGLGLAICRGLVEAMDGQIGVESAPGEGSTFWFEVAAPRASAVSADTPDINILPGLRVLVADDNPTNREIVRGLLAPYEAEVSDAADGVEAVELAMAEPFDIILMDIRMPRLDGADATLQIRERPGPNQRIPILAFTANFDLERYGEQASRGFNGVARKPIDGPAMLAEIARHTEVDLEAWTSGEAAGEAAV
jgi:PAS domain S-box-containing protein